MKWLFKGIMTGRQTSGSNSPLYAGLAVLRLFLSCRLLWISDSNKNTIYDASLHPNISVFVCFCVSLFHSELSRILNNWLVSNMNLKVIRNITHDGTGIWTGMYFKPIQHSHAADEHIDI